MESGMDFFQGPYRMFQSHCEDSDVESLNVGNRSEEDGFQSPCEDSDVESGSTVIRDARTTSFQSPCEDSDVERG